MTSNEWNAIRSVLLDGAAMALITLEEAVERGASVEHIAWLTTRAEAAKKAVDDAVWYIGQRP